MSINDLLTFGSLYLLLAWLFGSGGSDGVLEKKSRVANFRVNPSFFLVLASYNSMLCICVRIRQRVWFV